MPESVLKPGKSIYDYMPTTSDFSLKEARAEYSRLRKIASKRLARLEKSPYGSSDIFRRYAGQFAPLPRGSSEERVRKKLSEVARFTELKTASVSGMKTSREKQIEKMHEEGYDWINKDNINPFNDYMERIKKFTAAKQYDSEQIVDLFREAYESEVDPMEVAEDFQDYLDGIKTIPEPPPADEDEKAALEEIRGQAQPELAQPEPVQPTPAKQPKKPKNKSPKSALDKRQEFIRRIGRGKKGKK